MKQVKEDTVSITKITLGKENVIDYQSLHIIPIMVKTHTHGYEAGCIIDGKVKSFIRKHKGEMKNLAFCRITRLVFSIVQW